LPLDLCCMSTWLPLLLLCSYARAACVVMLLHDINDVLMETAKILNYAAYELGSTIVFVCFMISWAVLRIIIFPVYIIYSCFFEVQVRLLAIVHSLNQFYIINSCFFEVQVRLLAFVCFLNQFKNLCYPGVLKHLRSCQDC